VSDKKIYMVPIPEAFIDMLIDMGRLTWPQKGDPLEIGKVTSAFLDEWVKSGKSIHEFIDDIKREYNARSQTTTES
jgi:hypothetical protein